MVSNIYLPVAGNVRVVFARNRDHLSSIQMFTKCLSCRPTSKLQLNFLKMNHATLGKRHTRIPLITHPGCG
ncbi:hypothetical protein AB1N83_004826 [Pleurotus pulmonarius]